MKKIFIRIIFLFIFLVPITVHAENLTPKVEDTSQKVYDFADLLTEEEEDELQLLASNYMEKYKMDMVLVTINKNPYGVSDYYTKEYSMDFYDYNEFGVGNTKDGIIVLIDMDNRYPYISTTGNAILVYDDERIEKIHDYAYDYLRAGMYYDALKAYVTKSVEYAEDGIPESNKYYCIDEDGEYYKCKKEPKNVNWIITCAVAIFGSVVPTVVHTRKYKGIKLATNANSYLKRSVQNANVDNFLTTHTTSVRRSHDSDGGGHSFGGGGSSISRGSSGTSHGGGGGRHF